MMANAIEKVGPDGFGSMDVVPWFETKAQLDEGMEES
jgi:hypothetical protein